MAPNLGCHRDPLIMDAGSWEDDDFEVPALAAPPEEEEPFVPPRAPADGGAAGEDGPAEPPDRPVLLLDLSAMARQLGQDDSSVAEVRAQVVDALNASFLVKSAELLVSGLCWHSVNWRCAEDRAQREEELEPGSVLTVIPYPDYIDGMPVEELWAGVCRPTAWEVVDLIKSFVADCHRDIRWKADVCREVEALAEREMCILESRRASRSKVESLASEKQRTLESIRAAHEQCHGEPPERVLRSMMSMLHNLDSHLGEATTSHEALLEEGGEEAAEGEASAVDLLIGMVFQRFPRRAGWAGAEDMAWRSSTQRDLRRMWLGTFQRLPAASKLAQKHRIGNGMQQGSQARAPRMLVPPPISVGTEGPRVGGKAQMKVARRSDRARGHPVEDGGGAGAAECGAGGDGRDVDEATDEGISDEGRGQLSPQHEEAVLRSDGQLPHVL